jgi:Domain of unknown function (DUF5666)
MRMKILAGGVVTAAAFAVGLTVGQVAGIGTSSAAGSTPPATFNSAHRLTGSHPPFSLGPRADGTVTAIKGNTITVKADGNHGPRPSNEYDSVTTISLSSSTSYSKGFGQSASASDIKVGSYIIAQGTLNSDGTTLTASKVMVAGFGGPDGHLGFGPPGRGPGMLGGRWR